MSEQKRPPLDVRVVLTGELAEAFLQFEKELRRGHADAARVILREYLTLTGYFEPTGEVDNSSV